MGKTARQTHPDSAAHCWIDTVSIAIGHSLSLTPEPHTRLLCLRARTRSRTMNLENVRMLPNDAEEDVEVERADQEKINAFSSLNHRLNDIEDLLELKKDEKEQLEDLSMELELA